METKNSQNNQNNDWKNREVGALWKKKNDKGSYCTGYVISEELGSKSKQRVIMFSNKNKSNEKSPDFIIYLSNEDAVAKPQSSGNKTAPPKKAQVVSDDEIPNDLE